jgi:hypothetical protein
MRVTHLSSTSHSYNNIDNQCWEILFLCKRAIAHPDFLKTFVFDLGLIPALTTVLLSSHEKSAVEEAIRVGKEIWPRREGVWDSGTMVQIEENNLQEKYGESSASLNSTTTSPNMWQNKGHPLINILERV